MLTLSESAVTLIEDLLQHSELPAGAGLRIAQRDDHPALAMSLVEHAEARDVVLRDGASTVFLAPIAAAQLSGETLDARTTETGSAFYVRP